MKRKLLVQKQIQSTEITVSLIDAGNNAVSETGVSPELIFSDVLRMAIEHGGRLNELNVTFPSLETFREFSKAINKEINN